MSVLPRAVMLLSWSIIVKRLGKFARCTSKCTCARHSVVTPAKQWCLCNHTLILRRSRGWPSGGNKISPFFKGGSIKFSCMLPCYKKKRLCTLSIGIQLWHWWSCNLPQLAIASMHLCEIFLPMYMHIFVKETRERNPTEMMLIKLLQLENHIISTKAKEPKKRDNKTGKMRVQLVSKGVSEHADYWCTGVDAWVRKPL